MNEYFIGLDLGKRRDYSALAVLERAEVKGAWDPVYWRHKMLTERSVRHLERLPLETSYTDVVWHVEKVLRSLAPLGRCTLAVDATGLGAPVVDALNAAHMQCKLLPVILTAGELESCKDEYHMVPKRDVVTGLELLMERGELLISSGLEQGPVFLQELKDVEVKVSAAGRESCGATRAGTHDDLVIAVALACWAMGRNRGTVGEQSTRLL
jgi:hypothetical protein